MGRVIAGPPLCVACILRQCLSGTREYYGRVRVMLHCIVSA